MDDIKHAIFKEGLQVDSRTPFYSLLSQSGDDLKSENGERLIRSIIVYCRLR